jgi:helix-turn-helix protein
MDNPSVGRKKKSDKARDKYARNGGFSQKHIRIAQALSEKNVRR